MAAIQAVNHVFHICATKVLFLLFRSLCTNSSRFTSCFIKKEDHELTIAYVTAIVVSTSCTYVHLILVVLLSHFSALNSDFSYIMCCK